MGGAIAMLGNVKWKFYYLKRILVKTLKKKKHMNSKCIKENNSEHIEEKIAKKRITNTLKKRKYI